MSRSINRKKKLKRLNKFKLIFDEGLPPTKSYPNLNSFHDLVHVSHDLNKDGISDDQVYKLALKENRIVVVFNTKDFRPLIETEKPTVIKREFLLGYSLRSLERKYMKVINTSIPA